MSIRKDAIELLSSFGLFVDDERGDISSLTEIAIGLAIFFIVVGYILAPVGLTAFGSVNRTSAGVAAGTTAGNTWDALLPVAIAVIILALIMVIKKYGQ